MVKIKEGKDETEVKTWEINKQTRLNEIKQDESERKSQESRKKLNEIKIRWIKKDEIYVQFLIRRLRKKGI